MNRQLFFNLFRAEWIKILGHRWATSLLILIFPASAVLFVTVSSLIVIFSESARPDYVDMDWTEGFLYTWAIPGGEFGRLLLLGFTAVIFAGEYQWETWKNIIPRRQRTTLILVKFFTVVMFIWFAFIITSIIFGIGTGITVYLAGGDYGASELDGEVVMGFIEDYLLEMSISMLTTIIAAAYTTTAGMFTRSILGGFLIGFVATIGEGAVLLAVYLIYQVIPIEEIFEIFKFVPLYNLSNMGFWITSDKPWSLEVSEDPLIVIEESLWFSLTVLSAWVVGLISFTIFLFNRQDITH